VATRGTAASRPDVATVKNTATIRVTLQIGNPSSRLRGAGGAGSGYVAAGSMARLQLMLKLSRDLLEISLNWYPSR
jgi:hypothetical protein